MVSFERTSVSVTVITATGIEARAARRAMPNAQVVEAGIGLARLASRAFEGAIVCGLGGGLRAGIPSGTVVIASEVLRDDGTTVTTDSELSAALAAGARSLGFEPLVAPLLASATLVLGAERERWAQRGYAVADMESGLVDARRLAVVRVVLDTPERELSPEWLNPVSACTQPRLWGELLWLMRAAPRYARVASEVVRAGLSRTASTEAPPSANDTAASTKRIR